MNSAVWSASGHLAGFSDPLIDCRKCGARFRADKLIDSAIAEAALPKINVEALTNDEMEL